MQGYLALFFLSVLGAWLLLRVLRARAGQRWAESTDPASGSRGSIAS